MVQNGLCHGTFNLGDIMKRTRATDFMKPRVGFVFLVTDNGMMLLLSIYVIISPAI